MAPPPRLLHPVRGGGGDAAMHSISVSGACDSRPCCFLRARTKKVCGSSGGITVVVRRGEPVRRSTLPLPTSHEPFINQLQASHGACKRDACAVVPQCLAEKSARINAACMRAPYRTTPILGGSGVCLCRKRQPCCSPSGRIVPAGRLRPGWRACGGAEQPARAQQMQGRRVLVGQSVRRRMSRMGEAPRQRVKDRRRSL